MADPCPFSPGWLSPRTLFWKTDLSLPFCLTRCSPLAVVSWEQADDSRRCCFLHAGQAISALREVESAALDPAGRSGGMRVGLPCYDRRMARAGYRSDHSAAALPD